MERVCDVVVNFADHVEAQAQMAQVEQTMLNNWQSWMQLNRSGPYRLNEHLYTSGWPWWWTVGGKWNKNSICQEILHVDTQKKIRPRFKNDKQEFKGLDLGLWELLTVGKCCVVERRFQKRNRLRFSGHLASHPRYQIWIDWLTSPTVFFSHQHPVHYNSQYEQEKR